MPHIDEIDNLITTGTLDAALREPWSPDLANAIREASRWKLINLDKLGNISKEDKIKEIIDTMKRPVTIKRNYLKIICKNLKTALTQLKKVKQNATTHREYHLRQQAEEY